MGDVTMEVREIRAPPDVWAAAEIEARAMGISVPEFTRTALVAYIVLSMVRRDPAAGELLADIPEAAKRFLARYPLP